MFVSIINKKCKIRLYNNVQDLTSSVSIHLFDFSQIRTFYANVNKIRFIVNHQ
jgi:hypothetical protein